MVEKIICVIFAVQGCLLFAQNGYSGLIDASDEINVKLSREIAKTRLQRHRNVDEYIEDEGVKKTVSSEDDSQNHCGAVDIGNLKTGGFGDFGKKETNVVIIGDVINANNRCN